MGKASNFNSVREKNLYFFGGGGNEKLPKTDFFRKTLTPRNLLKEIFSSIGPCRSLRPDESENV